MLKRIALLAATLAALSAGPARAQLAPPGIFGGPPPGPPKAGKAGAPIDLTGYWVSVVTEDWRWRMVTPLKGDAASVPITPEARRIIDAWDPAKDEAAGLQCKAYAAPGIMRLPGRLHISWQDDMTLKIETDYGQQVRLLHFTGQPAADMKPSWQGYSAARWEPGGQVDPSAIPLGVGSRIPPRSRSMTVVTTNLRPGYLRKNGIPYSAKTTLREYYDLFTEPNGDTWFMVMTIVDDPVYLRRPFVTTTHFKKQADASGWSPEPCTAR
jgi:hypothetical protein